MAEDIANLVLVVNSDGIEKASKRLDQLTKTSKTTSQTTAGVTRGMSGINKAANDAAGWFRVMKGATQNLSYQLQDIAIQAQMGTNAFTILGQQGPQIASIFGPGGAVFGVLIAVGAMIGGTLVAAMGDAEQGTDELDAALERLDGTVVKAKTGVFELSERIQELAMVSVAAASAELLALGADAEFAFKKATDSVDALAMAKIDNLPISLLRTELEKMAGIKGLDADKLIREWDSSMSSMVGFGHIREALIDMRDEFGITVPQAFKFIEAIGGLKDGDLQSYDNLRAVIDEIGSTTNFVDRDLGDFRRELVAGVEAAGLAQKQVEGLKKAFDGLASSGVAGLTPMLSGTADEEEAGLAMRQKAFADFDSARLKAAWETSEAELKILDEQHRTAADFDSAFLAREASKAEAAAKSLATRKDQAQDYLDTVKMLGLDEDATFAARQAQTLAKLKEHYAAELISKKERDEGMAALQREADARALTENSGYMIAWQEQTLEAMTNMDMMGASMATNFTNSMGGAFESILTGTASAEDAFKNMAGGMAKAIVGSLAQMAAQWVAYQIAQKVMGKAAQAGEASAMSLNASAAVAMAGLNAFASTAAIPIVGPFMAPAASAAAMAATAPMAATVAALSTAAIGARALGGQVRGGESYLVGERGPELLHMGTSGRVVPNDKLGGGGGGVSIVNNIDASGNGAEVDIKIQQAMIQTNRQTVAQVQDLLKRGRLT